MASQTKPVCQPGVSGQAEFHTGREPRPRDGPHVPRPPGDRMASPAAVTTAPAVSSQPLCSRLEPKSLAVCEGLCSGLPSPAWGSSLNGVHHPSRVPGACPALCLGCVFPARRLGVKGHLGSRHGEPHSGDPRPRAGAPGRPGTPKVMASDRAVPPPTSACPCERLRSRRLSLPGAQSPMAAPQSPPLLEPRRWAPAEAALSRDDQKTAGPMVQATLKT